MMTRHFGMGFFGRSPFDKDARKKLAEKWAQMTDSEKLEFMNKRMSHMNQDDHFSVEAIDARCEAWMKMTPEEKQAFVNERKAEFEKRHALMHNFHNYREGFDCFGWGSPAEDKK